MFSERVFKEILEDPTEKTLQNYLTAVGAILIEDGMHWVNIMVAMDHAALHVFSKHCPVEIMLEILETKRRNLDDRIEQCQKYVDGYLDDVAFEEAFDLARKKTRPGNA
jgi:predicted RNA-binding protein associated with RNAse of E/G family